MAFLIWRLENNYSGQVFTSDKSLFKLEKDVCLESQEEPAK